MIIPPPAMLQQVSHYCSPAHDSKQFNQIMMEDYRHKYLACRKTRAWAQTFFYWMRFKKYEAAYYNLVAEEMLDTIKKQPYAI
jgi:hypothetical protein